MSMPGELGNHRSQRALKYYSRLGRPMPDNDLSPHRHQPCRAPITGTASVASIGSSLRAAYPVEDELAPALQAALVALTDHSRDHRS